MYLTYSSIFIEYISSCKLFGSKFQRPCPLLEHLCVLWKNILTKAVNTDITSTDNTHVS